MLISHYIMALEEVHLTDVMPCTIPPVDPFLPQLLSRQVFRRGEPTSREGQREEIKKPADGSTASFSVLTAGEPETGVTHQPKCKGCPCKCVKSRKLSLASFFPSFHSACSGSQLQQCLLGRIQFLVAQKILSLALSAIIILPLSSVHCQ